MDNNIEKFDPSQLMEGVKDRIKATFVSMIPDDVWNQMVEREIYIFTEGRIKQEYDYSTKQYKEVRVPYQGDIEKDQWGNKKPDDISPLQEMIRQGLRDKFKEDIDKYLKSSEYQAVWDQYGMMTVSKAIEEIIVKNSGIILQNALGELMQRGFENLRASISQVHYQ